MLRSESVAKLCTPVTSFEAAVLKDLRLRLTRPQPWNVPRSMAWRGLGGVSEVEDMRCVKSRLVGAPEPGQARPTHWSPFRTARPGALTQRDSLGGKLTYYLVAELLQAATTVRHSQLRACLECRTHFMWLSQVVPAWHSSRGTTWGGKS